ncbi:hypothetical protein FRX31_004192 [Thalictrum thalictroides]|uniref:Defensin-like protein n=1 Tax=Thalictrum thalictroides TaxID=46969 RepID=A0A7J6XB61_THATH|nr:hypothetical protein FRX31_004192 [Thalictrum thalictroides]
MVKTSFMSIFLVAVLLVATGLPSMMVEVKAQSSIPGCGICNIDGDCNDCTADCGKVHGYCGKDSLCKCKKPRSDLWI